MTAHRRLRQLFVFVGDRVDHIAMLEDAVPNESVELARIGRYS
jgi:hypothetical protein